MIVKFLRRDFPFHVDLDRVLEGLRCSGLKETSRVRALEDPELPDGSGLVVDSLSSSVGRKLEEHVFTREISRTNEVSR